MWYYRKPQALSESDVKSKMETAFAEEGAAPERLQPVAVEGRTIARTFWGRGWCSHFEGMADFDNRLPRGRTYARKGAVRHLELSAGRIFALVSGSDLYKVEMAVAPLPAARWAALKKRCLGRISTMTDLLMGRLSEEVMAAVCDRDDGLFPRENEIKFVCSCPDWAALCKHVASIFYGVGHRLDASPELLFQLRGVDPAELLAGELMLEEAQGDDSLAGTDLGALFGVDLSLDEGPARPEAAGRPGPKDKKVKKDARDKPAERPDERPDAKARKDRKGRKVRPAAAVEEASAPEAWPAVAQRSKFGAATAWPPPEELEGSAAGAQRSEFGAATAWPPPEELEGSSGGSAAGGQPAEPPDDVDFESLSGRGVRDLRRWAKLEPAEMARELGVSLSSLTSWEAKLDRPASIRSKAAEKIRLWLKARVRGPEASKGEPPLGPDFDVLTGADVKALRDWAELGQDELAAELEVTWQCLKVWEAQTGPLNLQPKSKEKIRHWLRGRLGGPAAAEPGPPVRFDFEVVTGADVRALRLWAKLSAERMAEEIGVSLLGFKRWESLDGPLTLMPKSAAKLRIWLQAKAGGRAGQSG
ncbi:MAG: hypothetical protein LBU12_02215 [Deltaproteobacteria bacterium]|jgi:uncharacterized Zn finger protein/DNA-binding transcriptional regulator YiaG|nr:hypothetical protein [Deltaproteobacteria bacterium]